MVKPGNYFRTACGEVNPLSLQTYFSIRLQSQKSHAHFLHTFFWCLSGIWYVSNKCMKRNRRFIKVTLLLTFMSVKPCEILLFSVFFFLNTCKVVGFMLLSEHLPSMDLSPGSHSSPSSPSIFQIVPLSIFLSYMPFFFLSMLLLSYSLRSKWHMYEVYRLMS